MARMVGGGGGGGGGGFRASGSQSCEERVSRRWAAARSTVVSIWVAAMSVYFCIVWVIRKNWVG